MDDETLEKAKAFFQKQGLEVACGITYTINEANEFETFSYSDPSDRAKVRFIAEHTARHFDEFLLDDFFFTSSKKDVEIEAKGNRSWTEYRLDLLKEAGQFYNNGTSTNALSEKSISYDKAGNITALSRYNNSGAATSLFV